MNEHFDNLSVQKLTNLKRHFDDEDARDCLVDEEMFFISEYELELPDKLTDDTPIYRYVSAPVFISMLDSGQNWLSHISMWDDPFEGFVFRGNAADKEIDNGDNSQCRYFDWFGQSWTYSATESDLRWRAYCPNGDGVRIGSTIGKLKNSLHFESANEEFIGLWASRVFYKDRQVLNDMVAKYKGSALMLFFKDKAFFDEFEYRVVADKSVVGDKYIDRGFMKFDLERDDQNGAFKLFDEILLDPRMSDQDVERLKTRIALAGVRCRVAHSQVYKWK